MPVGSVVANMILAIALTLRAARVAGGQACPPGVVLAPADLAADAVPTCTWLVSPAPRPAIPLGLVAEGVGRRTHVGRYFQGMDGLQRDSGEFTLGVDIYGENLRVRKVVGPGGSLLRGAREIIVVWWSFGTACERRPPLESMLIGQGEEVFIAALPRPPAEWVDGLPTFDVDAMDYFYSPGIAHPIRFWRPNPSLRQMSAREFAGLFEAMPTRMRPDSASAERLARWRRNHPDLVLEHPAARILDMYDVVARLPPD